MWLNGLNREDPPRPGAIISTTSAPSPDDVWVGGLRFRLVDGALVTNKNAGTIVGAVNGWPVDANGAVVVDYLNADAVDHVQNGIPFVVDGRVAIRHLGGIDHYQNGLPFASDGHLRMEDVSPPATNQAFDNGFSGGFA